MTGNLNTLLKRIVDDLFQRVPALYRCIEDTVPYRDRGHGDLYELFARWQRE